MDEIGLVMMYGINSFANVLIDSTYSFLLFSVDLFWVIAVCGKWARELSSLLEGLYGGSTGCWEQRYSTPQLIQRWLFSFPIPIL